MFRSLTRLQSRDVFAAAIAVLLVLAGTSPAISAEWWIAKMSGDVRVHGKDNVWVKAKPM